MHCMSNFKKGAFFIVVALFFSACTRSSNPGLSDVDDNGGYASDASRIELATDDVISMADEAGNLYNGAYISPSNSLGLSDVEVGTDTLNSPHRISIYFGNTNLVCSDGRKRRGSIFIYFNGRYTDAADVHTIVFDRYFLNDNQLTGSILTTRVDTTITGNWYYNVQVGDSLNMSQDPLQSQFVTWTGNVVRKWIGGYLTNDRNDDAFSISGGATLVRPNGHSFACGISTPLKIAINCDFVESGVINVTSYKGPRVLNYGDGNCDANAQLSIGPNVYPIKLTK
jgi:hypothetical protein